ncbi:MAG: hypothetical protein ACI93R_002797 [Flavobacteriales bacterium]
MKVSSTKSRPKAELAKADLGGTSVKSTSYEASKSHLSSMLLALRQGRLKPEQQHVIVVGR